MVPGNKVRRHCVMARDEKADLDCNDGPLRAQGECAI